MELEEGKRQRSHYKTKLMKEEQLMNIMKYWMRLLIGKRNKVSHIFNVMTKNQLVQDKCQRKIICNLIQ